MAIEAKTVTSYDLKNERPEFADIFKDVSPGATPLLTHIGGNSTKKVPNREITWGKTELTAITADDAGTQEAFGPDTYNVVPASTAPLKNYHQNMTTWFALDNRALVSRQYGKRELARLTLMYGKRLKGKVERLLGARQLPRKGNKHPEAQNTYRGTWAAGVYAVGDYVKHGNAYFRCTVARDAMDTSNPTVDTTSWASAPTNTMLAGSIFGYLTMNNARGTGGGKPVLTDGLPSSNGTEGANRAITVALVRALLQDIKTQGLGFPGLGVSNLGQRDVLMGLLAGGDTGYPAPTMDAFERSYVKDLSMRGAVAIVSTAEGTFELHHSDYMPSGADAVMYFINPKYWGLSHIDKLYGRHKMSTEGDYQRYYMRADVSVQAYGEESSGALSDLSAPP